jgi:hypothetical protein
MSKASRLGTDPAIAPSWEIIALVALLVFYACGFEAWGASAYDVMNLIGPFALIGILGFGAYSQARANPAFIWTILFWFRISTVVYFGFGDVFPLLANDKTKAYMDEFFWAQPWHYYKSNLIVTVSVLVVLLSSSVTAGVLASPRTHPNRTCGSRDLLIVGLLFGVVGFSTQVLFTLPSMLGAYGNQTLPGFIVNLEIFSSVSLYLLTRYALQHSSGLFPVALFALLVEMGIGFITFAKISILFPFLMFLLAYFSQRASLWRNLGAFGAVLLLFIFVVPIVSFGREEVHSHGDRASVAERLAIVASYFDRREPLEVEEKLQDVLRLSYVGQTAAAIDMYDNGRPGTSLDNAWAVFIPRMLWPEKPVITQIALDFTALAGAPENSTSPGIFADAYWDFGWAGVVGIMAAIGALFGILSRYALSVMATGAWIQLPIVMLAMKTGMRVDGFIVSDILGPSVLLFFLYLGVKAGERLIVMLFSRGQRGGNRTAYNAGQRQVMRGR